MSHSKVKINIYFFEFNFLIGFVQRYHKGKDTHIKTKLIFFCSTLEVQHNA